MVTRVPVEARLAAAIVLIMLIMPLAPIATATQSRAPGVDLRPTGFSTQYVDSGDRSEFGLLSRATPPTHPTRSSNLWVVDGLVGKGLSISATVRNDGDASASSFDVQFVVIHDEYGSFEILNSSSTISSLAAGSSNTASTTWTPTYSGNHTLRIETVSIQDSNLANDRIQSTITIGAMYETAESGTSWTRGNGWNIDSTHSLGGTSSFKIGASGTSGQYSNLWTTSVTSPSMDLSDAHTSPNSGFGIGFFYTGSTESNDRMMLQVVSAGNVHDVMGSGGLSGNVNGQPNQWLINVNNVGGRSVPWYPIDPSTLSSNSQFRFLFTSDATGTDVGYWIDDIVMFYDQKAAPKEFRLTASGASHASAPRTGWGDLSFSVRNDGNVTDRFTLAAEGLPSDWNIQFANPSGSGLVAGTEIELQAGETRAFVLKFQPPEDSATVSESGTIRIQSVLESTAVATHGFTATVDPRYAPEWEGDLPTQRCAPGQTCTFTVRLTNGGDGSDTFVLSAAPELLPDDWSFGLSSDQPSSVTLQPGEGSDVKMAVAVPVDAPSGTDARCRLIAESQADSSSTMETTVNVTASMISAASVVLDQDSLPGDGLLGIGEHVDLIYVVTNEANRQDIYSVSLEGLTGTEWDVTILGVPTLSVASNDSGLVRVRLTAPADGLANDPATRFEVVLTSGQSGSTFRSSQFEGVRVSMHHDLSITLTAEPTSWTPSIADAIRLNVTNEGNGDDQVYIDVTGLPTGWNWSIRVDGVASSIPFPIGLAPDADSTRSVEIVVDPSGSASPGTTVKAKITVSPAIGLDVDPADNEITSSIKVESIRLAEMSGFPVQERSGILLGSTSFEEVTIRNEGNAYDGGLQVRLRMDPMMPELEAAIIVDGVEHGLTSWVDIPLSPQAEVMVVTRLMIGEGIPLETKVTLTVDVRREGDASPIALTSSLTYTADEERVIEAETTLEETFTADLATSGDFAVDVTSRSTRDEEVYLRSFTPSGWTMSCTPTNGRGDSYRLILEPDSSVGRTLPFDCDYVVAEDAEDGTIRLELHDADGTVLWLSIHTATIVRPDNVEDEPLLSGGTSTALAAGGLVSLLAIATVLFTLMMRRRKSLDEEPLEEKGSDDLVSLDGHPTPVISDYQTTQQPAQTPPATTAHAAESEYQYPTAHASHPQVTTDHGMIWDGQRWVAPQVGISSQAAQYSHSQDQLQQQFQPQPTVETPYQQETPNLAYNPEPTHPIGAQEAATAPVGQLDGAFASLGMTHQDVGSGPVDAAIEPSETFAQPVESVFEPVQSEVEFSVENATMEDAEQTAASGTTPLPIIACTHCHNPLGPTDIWSECPGCGGYRHQACLGASPICPRCHSS